VVVHEVNACWTADAVNWYTIFGIEHAAESETLILMLLHRSKPRLRQLVVQFCLLFSCLEDARYATLVCYEALTDLKMVSLRVILP